MVSRAPRQPALRPHDVAVALQMMITPDLTFAELAARVHLSVGETHNASKRLVMGRLVGEIDRSVPRDVLLLFLMHGVPHAFPPVVGPVSIGIPTAHAAPPLAAVFSNAEPVVWPHVDGTVRGSSLVPLYPAAPVLAGDNPALYELLALTDALRGGRARERKEAIAALRVRVLDDRYP